MECQSCKVISDNNLCHYKTDWHIHNVRLKCADRPPLTLDEFDAFEQLQNHAQPSQFVCSVCDNRSFKTVKALEAHFGNKKHIKSAQNASKGSLGVEKPIAFSGKTLQDGDCLFCDFNINDSVSLIAHLKDDHSFLIFKENLLHDKTGFIESLRDQLNAGLCLFCHRHYSAKNSDFDLNCRSVQQHMNDKNHQKLLLPSRKYFELYETYYGFTDPQKMQIARDVVGHGKIDDLATETGELLLGEGTLLGHRRYREYYRQREVVPSRRETERLALFRANKCGKEENKRRIASPRDLAAAAKMDLLMAVRTNTLARPKIKKLH